MGEAANTRAVAGMAVEIAAGEDVDKIAAAGVVVADDANSVVGMIKVGKWFVVLIVAVAAKDSVGPSIEDSAEFAILPYGSCCSGTVTARG